LFSVGGSFPPEALAVGHQRRVDGAQDADELRPSACDTGPMTSTASRLDRISVDPAIVHGKPVIRGTRVTVQVILELLAAGETIDELLSEYDELTRDDILAALEYAASVAGGTQVISFVA